MPLGLSAMETSGTRRTHNVDDRLTAPGTRMESGLVAVTFVLIQRLDEIMAVS